MTSDTVDELPDYLKGLDTIELGCNWPCEEVWKARKRG